MSSAESIARHSSIWVRSPAWDAMWMLNALWLVPIALWLGRGHSISESGLLDLLYLVLTAGFWIGHRLCSVWLAYCTEAYRPILRDQPLRFIALPLLITVACLALVLPTDEALPWTRAQRIVSMAIVDYALVTYHFSAQHFGVLSLYRIRAGRTNCLKARCLDRIFALSVGGILILIADILAGSVAYQDLWIDHWLAPAWVASNQARIRLGASLMVLLATGLVLFAEARAPRRSLARALYVVGLAAMVVVALQPRRPFLYIMVWTSQHWIVATGLASQTPIGEPDPARGWVRRILHSINARPLAILVTLVSSSALLLPFFEVEANLEGGTYYGDRMWGAFAVGLRTSPWVPALIAAGFSTGFVHYVLDRNVYRMSDPAVRVAARALVEGPFKS